MPSDGFQRWVEPPNPWGVHNKGKLYLGKP
jgi:hypothetical protein